MRIAYCVLPRLDALSRRVVRSLCVPLGLERGDGFAGELVNLKSADDAFCVVSADAVCGAGVDSLQLFI